MNFVALVLQCGRVYTFLLCTFLRRDFWTYTFSRQLSTPVDAARKYPCASPTCIMSSGFSTLKRLRPLLIHPSFTPSLSLFSSPKAPSVPSFLIVVHGAEPICFLRNNVDDGPDALNLFGNPHSTTIHSSSLFPLPCPSALKLL